MDNLRRMLGKRGKLHHLMSNTHGTMGIVDHEGSIVYVSPKMADLFNRDPGSMIGRSIIEFMDLEEGDLIEKSEVMNEEEYNFDLIKSDADNVFSGTITPLYDGDGVYLGALATVKSVADKSNNELALQESMRKLKLLTSLTRHDIINKVFSAQLLLSLGSESETLEEAREYISKVFEMCERIHEIIGFTKEYEDFGSISGGYQPIHHLIECAVSENVLGELRVINDIPGDLEVYADPMIRKVFSTLIENTVRHGEKATYVQFEWEERIGYYVIICNDNGVGVQIRDKDNIFKHGFGHNTGIGLFLSKGILSITGLYIREVGSPNEGAKFEILVPWNKVKQP